MPQRVEFGVNHNGETALQSAHPEHDVKLLPENKTQSSRQNDGKAMKDKGLMSETCNPCVAAPTVHPPAGIGHNGGPEVEPFGLRAAWLRFADEMELRRLAKLHVRIERRKRGLADLVAERRAIMNRCIRRMRRANGKN